MAVSVKNILVLNLTRMGDLVQSTPLIAGLRKKYPQSKITLAVSGDFAEFADYVPGVDHVRVFNIRQFEKPADGGGVNWVVIYRYIEEFMNGLREGNYDMLVNLSHSKLSALMLCYLKIANVRGFDCDEEGNRKTHHPWMQYFGIQIFNRAMNTFNLVDVYARAGDILPDGGVSVRVPEEEGLEMAGAPQVGADEFVVGMQVGSSIEDRRWPSQSFAELADRLVEEQRARIVVFGVASESPAAENMIRFMKHGDRVINLCGKTRIPQLIRWMKRCSYLVTNDTGTMHIASAVGTKVVALFFAHAHAYETGPYGNGHLIFQARISCSPCSYGVHCGNIVCVRKVSPELVYSVMRQHIQSGAWRVPEDAGNLDEVDIHETWLENGNLYRLRPLVRRRVAVDDVLRSAYRRMWLARLPAGKAENAEEIDTASGRLLELAEDFDLEGASHVFNDVRQCMRRFMALGELAYRGAVISDTLVKLALNVTPENVDRIHALGEEVLGLDEEISMRGLTHPELKPLTDMFCKRKENLEGDNVVRLAGVSRSIYGDLREESALMARLLYYTTEISDLRPDSNRNGVSSSMSVAVPGR